MNIPERYLDIRDYFEGLQIAGELSDESRIEIQKLKYQDSTQFVARTILGENRDYIGYDNKSYYFQRAKINKNYSYYFPYTVIMNRFEDDVEIRVFLPAAIGDEKEKLVFVNYKQVEKMYRNGLLYDLKVKGFKNISMTRASQGFELKAKLGPDHTHKDVADIYEIAKKRSTTAFNSLTR